MAGGGHDPVLGELADALLDLASPADPSAAADRIDVDAKLSGGIEHRDAIREPATPARRSEDDERVVSHDPVACRVAGSAASRPDGLGSGDPLRDLWPGPASVDAATA